MIVTAVASIITAGVVGWTGGRVAVVDEVALGGDVRAELELAWTTYAMEILSTDDPRREPRRGWAIAVVGHQSPVPLDAAARNGLLDGSAGMPAILNEGVAVYERRLQVDDAVAAEVRRSLRGGLFPRFADLTAEATDTGFVFRITLGGGQALPEWNAEHETGWYSHDLDFPEDQLWDTEHVVSWARSVAAREVAAFLREVRPDWRAR